jgi:hypothetical protein
MTIVRMSTITTYRPCKTCRQLVAFATLDTDGNGPCCRVSPALSELARLELDMQRVRDKMLFQQEQIRLLTLANKHLAAGLAAPMAELLQAAQAWRTAINPARPDGVADAERRLLEALQAVEEAQK